MKLSLKLTVAVALLFASRCSAEDWGQRVQAALASAGNHNTVVDMTDLSGPQSTSVNPFAELTGNANVVVKVGCYDITTTVPWVIVASHVRVEFCSSESQLKPAHNFPPAPLVTVGNNSIPIHGVMIEYGYLNCINLPGCSAYTGNSLNEFSGLRHVNIGNTIGSKRAAVQINGTAETMGHYILEDLQIVNVGTNDCISVVANGVNQHRIRDITCNNSAGTPEGKAGVHITSTQNGTVAALGQIHVEGFADGVFLDHEVTGTAHDIDCTNGCTNGVHIGNSCSDISLSAITVTSAANLVRNDCLKKNITRVSGGVSRTLAYYAQSNYGGDPARVIFWNGREWVNE
jgi:hypothetical protein